MWIVVGLLVYFAVSHIRAASRPANPHLYFWPIWLLLISTLVFGLVRHGSSRWLDLGIVQVQPSEFAKVFFVILLAYFLSEYTRREELSRFLWAGGTTLAFILPIIKQPDLGTAVVFLFVFFSVIFLKPVSGKYILALAVILSLLVVPGFFLLKDYQKQRIVAFLQPSRDPLGAGYHVNQSTIAIGSGGFTGKGFLHGTQTQGQFIPVQSLDFIFATVGEEWGFVGAVFVLSLFIALVFKGISLAKRVKTEYARLLAFGALSVILFQVFINVGMTIGLTPVTGVPLPFLSYGGSSMVTMWAFCGIFASLERSI